MPRASANSAPPVVKRDPLTPGFSRHQPPKGKLCGAVVIVTAKGTYRQDGRARRTCRVCRKTIGPRSLYT